MVLLARNELAWIASAGVAALPATRFASWTAVAFGLLLVAAAALWTGRVRRTRMLAAELRATNELLAAAMAERDAARNAREAMAAELDANRAAAAERGAEIERILSGAAVAAVRARARYAAEAQHASAEAAAHARRTSAAPRP